MPILRRPEALRTPGSRASYALFIALLLCLAGVMAIAAGVPYSALAGRGGEDRQVPASKDKPPLPSAPRQTPALGSPSDARQAQPLQPDRSGGPDAFGYVFSDERDPGGPAFDWQPASNRIPDDDWSRISSGQQGPLDDGVVTTTLPFNFNFYGTGYNVMHISTNGNVHFGPPIDYWPGASSACLPSNNDRVPRAMVAPLWLDLVVPPESAGEGGVYTDVVGTAPNRTFVVEWRAVTQYNLPSNNATFELFLSENGDMTFQYLAVNGVGVSGSSGVIGIQNAAGSVGLPYACYQEAVEPGRAIRFGIRQSLIFSPGTAQKGGAPGSTVVYTETLSNQTGSDNSFTIATSGNTWPTTADPPNTGTVPSGASIPVTVRVQIPANASIGARDVTTITVRSSLPSPGAYTSTAVLTTSVSTYGVDFTPPSQTKAGTFNSPVTYALGLTNRSGQSNSFTLRVTGNSWTTTVSPSETTNLAPDATAPVTIAVRVPPGSSLGARDAVTLTASSKLPSPGTYFGVTVITTTAGVWQRKSDLPAPRSRAVAVNFSPNNRIYIIGGENNNGDTNLPIEEYDPYTNSWRQRAGLPVGVSNAGAAAIGADIYIVGGYNSHDGTAQSVLQVYYPSDDRVETVATDPLPAPRLGMGVAAYAGKLYVIGGSDNSLVGTNSVYEYDPSRPAGQRWRSRASMPTARLYLGAGVVDGIIYAAGGMPGRPTDLSTLEAYNPASDSWSVRRPMSRGRAGLAVVGVSSSEPGCGGYLYALGGGWSNYTSSAERYDPSSNSWQPISGLSVARRSLAAAYSPALYSLVVMGGWNDAYVGITEAVQCSGAFTPPTPAPAPSPTPACSLSFTDVPPGSDFYPYIQCLACRGIVSGYEDGSFRPSSSITRGQLSKIVAGAANLNGAPTAQTFEDVTPGNTFYLYIGRMYSAGIISGYPCGGTGEPCGTGNRPYFRPSFTATRGQIAKIVSNARGFADTPHVQTFEDVAPGSTFYVWVERLAAHDVMSGYQCGGSGEPCGTGNRPYFRPAMVATRGQLSKIVANTFFPDCSTR